MNNEIKSLYKQFRTESGYCASHALYGARILKEFRELEADEKVELGCEGETESYFDVFGEPDTEEDRKRIEQSIENHGCYTVYTNHADTTGDMICSDSVGMCVYNDPTDPFENCYVVDLMDSAIKYYNMCKTVAEEQQAEQDQVKHLLALFEYLPETEPNVPEHFYMGSVLIAAIADAAGYDTQAMRGENIAKYNGVIQFAIETLDAMKIEPE